MNCNIELHDGLIDSGKFSCPFCDLKLCDYESKQEESCCDNKNVIENKGMNVCSNCGCIYGYEVVREYVDFYENKYRFRRKSIYHRKYHIRNKIFDIHVKYKINISVNNTKKICRVFQEIDNVLSQISDGRKRMISINYILVKLFKMLEIPNEYMIVTKSKKTLSFYEKYWGRIYDLIGDKIESIIRQ